MTYSSINYTIPLEFWSHKVRGNRSKRSKFLACDSGLCICRDDLRAVVQLVPANQMRNVQNYLMFFVRVFSLLTLFGWTWMLSGFVILRTLNKNGSVGIPPIDELSLAITLDRASPVDFTVDCPLTWSPILLIETCLEKYYKLLIEMCEFLFRHTTIQRRA